MGKYGTNLEGFGGFEGGVNADKGAPLISTSSDGETALLFGPAALREIQAGVANGDFAIPPDAAGDTITEENPLPYWTFTDTDSAGAITCAIVTDSGSGSGNILRWTVAAGTTTGKTAILSRYIPVAATRDQAFAFYPEFTMGAATNAASRQIILTMQFYTANQTTTGTAITHTYSFSDFNSTRTAVMLYGDTASRLQAPADAAFAKISMAIDTTGTNASASTLDVYEIRLLTAPPMILLGSRAATAGPAAIWKSGAEEISIAPNIPTSWTSGSLGTDRLRMVMVDGADPEISYFSTLGEVAHRVTGYYEVNPALATSTAFGANPVTGEAASRFQILASGKLEIGDGTNPYDTNLYRSAANTLKTDDSLAVGGTLIGSGVTTDLKHGITLQRTTNLTVNTSVDASATAITWSSAVKNTSLYAYWSSGSTIAIPLTGWYSITCHLISGTGLGTGFAFRLYALVNGTVIAESETQAGANTTSDTFAISTIAYMTAADSLVFRASASAASKTIGGSRRSACSVVYLGNTSA